MGIKRLIKYIDSNFHDWKDIRLEGGPVVLDGNGLPFYLTKKIDLAWKFGGQYPAFRDILESFFDDLRKRNVYPICVVFNSVDKVDVKKGTKEIVLESIIKGVERNEQQPVFPPLTNQTFYKFLEDYDSVHHNLQIYCGDKKTDNLGVVIANKYIRLSSSG